MSIELTKPLMCLHMRNGLEIWWDEETVKRFRQATEGITGSKQIWFEGEMFNTADMVDIVKASRVADLTRRKNGQWQCEKGAWHDRSMKCECLSLEEKKKIESREERIRDCGKCTGGWILGEHGAHLCTCQEGL